jgi:hypothetical protein
MELPGFQEFEFQARERPDWAYARTPRAAVLVPSAEWVQSVYSCEFELNGRWLLTPNRDYPYEGLLVHAHGENWKFIDCIAVNLRLLDGRPVRLLRDDPSMCVRVSPWSATYWYAFEEVNTSESRVAPRLYVRYLLDVPPDSESLTGRVEIGFENPWRGMAGDIELVVQPFLDLRHMFAAAEFEKYSIDTEGGSQPAARVRVYNRAITFHFPKGELTRFGNPERLDWWYKLGTGQRVEERDACKGQTRTTFEGEQKQVAAFFHFRPLLSEDTPAVTLRFTCELESQPRTALTPPDYLSIQSASERRNADLWRQSWSLCTLEASPEVKAAAAARVVCFANLRIFAKPPDSPQFRSVPPAGGWWFRTPWFRDIFEGLLTGFHTAMSLECERDTIWHTVELALANQDRSSGLVPNRVPEFDTSQPAYDGSDATLLCLIAGLRYALETRDRGIARRILRACVRAINCFRKAHASTPPGPGGGPRLSTDTGLLLTCPRHSWIDTRNQEVACAAGQVKGIPNRASPAFVTSMCQAVRDSERIDVLMSSPRFFMPEINAQWILMLRSLRENLAQVRPKAAEHRTATYSALSKLIERAERSFLRIFWNEEAGFLYNLVFEDCAMRDTIESEPAVVAAALLGVTVLSSEQLEAVWRRVQAKLLVNRRLTRFGDATLPFGILAMAASKGVFYNDGEYHADTVWLRSTPYLLRLLRSLGKEDTARQVILNTLDHQMCEGAIFYNQELLALPFGNNPDPDERTCLNPVPVKNPLQFWSQWCDPMFE